MNTCKITKEDADIPEEVLTMVRCKNCGFIFLNPRLGFSKNYIVGLYNKEYFNKGYMKFYSGGEECICQSNEPFSYRLDLIEKYKTSGKLLDVGCATGGFLRFAHSKGWQVWGVELSDYATEVAAKKYSLNVFKGFLEDAHFEDNYFDVVCASDILEHVIDPQNFLKEIFRILTNNGLLYLACPNADSFYYRFFSLIAHYNHKNYFVLPHHLYHFSPSTIKLLFDKVGFDICQLIFSHSHSEKFLMNIFNFRDRLLVIAIKTGDTHLR